jgi:hypothetical protein
VYFTSFKHLVPGEGTLPGESGLMIYRLDVASGDLKVIGAVGNGLPFDGSAMTPKGEVLIFTSANPRMNALTASDNAGIEQYYRYDDRNGSLICLTCQEDASYIADVDDSLVSIPGTSLIASPMSADGETFVFTSFDPLLPFDQNTSPARPWEGNDIYEWRDGRLMLVTDGMSTHSPLQQPRIGSVTPDGRNVFFVFPGELTREAEDAYQKVYTARIGGGFEIKDPPPPCPLEVCQGEATGPPADVVPGSASVSGPGDPKAALAPRKRKRRCGQAKRRMTVKGKSRCVAKPRRGRQGGAK